MKREIALAVGIILLLTLFLGLLVGYTRLRLAQPDYSYHAYYASHHLSVPACTLDGTRKTAQGVVLCAESAHLTLPTGAQTNAWVGYILWNACEQYGDTYACAQLGD